MNAIEGAREEFMTVFKFVSVEVRGNYQIYNFLGPIYTIANTQRIKIYPGTLEFSPNEISSDSKCLHCKRTKDNQTLATFATSENLSGLPCLQSYPNLFNYAVNLPG